jgi:Plasma-membrane choline transporter
MTYALIALTVLCFLATLLMIRRIAVAVACLKVASSAVGTIPSIMLFPIITFASSVGLFVYWVIVFAHQWSAGEVVETMRPPSSSSSSYSLTTLFDSASNMTASAVSTLAPAPASPANTTALECWEDPDCYYDVVFNQRQQVGCLHRRSICEAAPAQPFVRAATHQACRGFKLYMRALHVVASTAAMNASSAAVHVRLSRVWVVVDTAVHCWFWLPGHCIRNRGVLLEPRSESRDVHIPGPARHLGGSKVSHGVCCTWSLHRCCDPVPSFAAGVH